MAREKGGKEKGKEKTVNQQSLRVPSARIIVFLSPRRGVEEGGKGGKRKRGTNGQVAGVVR